MLIRKINMQQYFNLKLSMLEKEMYQNNKMHPLHSN